MSITAQDVSNLAPELAGEDQSRIDFFIDLATLFVPEGRWGDRYDKALTLYVAHLLTLANRGGNAGSVTQEKVGDVQKNYSARLATDSELALTSYGQMFLMLRRGLVTTPLWV